MEKSIQVLLIPSGIIFGVLGFANGFNMGNAMVAVAPAVALYIGAYMKNLTVVTFGPTVAAAIAYAYVYQVPLFSMMPLAAGIVIGTAYWLLAASEIMGMMKI